jgi:hypothetical protein
MKTKRAFSIVEFCESFAIGRTKTHDLIRSGLLPAVKVDRRTLILADDAEAFFRALRPAHQEQSTLKLVAKRTVGRP